VAQNNRPRRSFVPADEPATAEVVQLIPREQRERSITVLSPIPDIEDETINPKSQDVSMATEGELRAAEIAAAEARTDTKIVRLEGKLDLVINKIDSADRNVLESRRAVIANAWVIAGVMAVVIGIVATIFPVFFDLGMKSREAITKEIQEQMHKAPAAQPSTPRQ
jgi:hypothetical protein